MQARELVELAALAAIHAEPLVKRGWAIPKESIETYWTASKSRQDRWSRTLKFLGALNGQPGELGSPTILGFMEEILTGDVLARVWAAVMCAFDRQRGAHELEPVVRSVFLGQMECRHRVLTLMVSGPGLPVAEAVRLDALRTQAERWTDVLIGLVAGLADVSEFAFDARRVTEVGRELGRQLREPGGRHGWPILVASLRTAFRRVLGAASPNGDLNARIAVGILAGFPPEVFDATGLFPSAWLLRITSVADDAQGMLDSLLHAERSGEEADSTAPDRMPLVSRYRRYEF
jgi:hypothetical protein